MTQRVANIGWKMTATEAVCRCWATESAISLRASMRSSTSVRIRVVKGGMEERSGVFVRGSEVENGEGEGGGRVWEFEGVRRGVELLLDMAEYV
jgi:hypothetical protein